MSGSGELFVAVEGEGAYYNGVRVDDARREEDPGVDTRREEDREGIDVAGDKRGESQEFFDAGEREEDIEFDDQVLPEKLSKKLSDCNICVEFGYERDAEAIDAMTGVVGKILKNGCRSIRMMGSGVLDLIFVALGRYDAVYCGVAGEGWKVWDYAAASVFVRESGCLISNWGVGDVVVGAGDESSFNMSGSTCICCRSEHVREELVNILKNP
jgi:fructose-1,6-bisphosphatase/inositol monophosphatase family enzyme